MKHKKPKPFKWKWFFLLFFGGGIILAYWFAKPWVPILPAAFYSIYKGVQWWDYKHNN